MNLYAFAATPISAGFRNRLRLCTMIAPIPYIAKKRGNLSSEILFSKSGKRDSNPRPSAWEADALPTELLPHLLLFSVHKGKSYF